ncbi:MAG: ABC transporter ATP-binding protein [Oscillospiraceae bacterium]|nr:ABC transporter ATP-binding protein [Oscillospiraceae bacterium]
MTQIISAQKVHKIYRIGETSVHALAGVTFTVGAGEFVAITGASGSGKSTLLNMLAGLEPVSAGAITIAGERIDEMDEGELVNFRRDNVGFVFQSFNLIPTMTAAENVALPLSFRGVSRAARDEAARRMLDIVGLSSHADHRPMQMSGGQQQRVGIARALVVDPKIIFADEPTGNLDSRNGAEIMDLLRSIVDKNGQTVVMVTHDLPLSQRTDRIIFLSDGRITKEEITEYGKNRGIALK